MGEDDEAGWQALSGSLGEGCSSSATVSLSRTPRASPAGVLANAVLIKPNQIGTLTETVEAVRAAQAAGWATVYIRSAKRRTAPSPTSRSLGCAQIKAALPAAAHGKVQPSARH